MNFRYHYVASALLLSLLIWLSSGTMAPYGATHRNPEVTPQGYVVNIDHPHHKAVFLMLDGADRKLWEHSVVLRRILFPLLAYPIMKLWGFEIGGFFASLGMHLLAFSVFGLFIKKEIGDRAGIFAMWLLATYPGIAYWAALPYAYAAIVPCSLLAVVVLWRLSEAETIRQALMWGLALGVLSTAYDLLPFFGLAALVVVFVARRYRQLPCVTIGMIVPQVLVCGVLGFIYQVSLKNSNSEIYSTVLSSYLHPGDLSEWADLLKHVPVVALKCYFFSNFYFLPLLFLAVGVLNRLGSRMKMHVVEKAVLLAVALIFLFNNLAPPYPGWQMRGVKMARLYQPVFVVFVTFAVRVLEDVAVKPWAVRKIVASLLVATTTMGNAAISFGPLVDSPYTGTAYFRFYRHSPPGALSNNLRRYGRRPLGFCRPLADDGPRSAVGLEEHP